MKFFTVILVSALLISPYSHAEQTQSERLEIVLEVDNFIVNYSPSGDSLGRIIAARCPDCLPETMTFDQNTVFEVDGQVRPIDEIRLKADWSGLITVTNLAPSQVIKITIY